MKRLLLPSLKVACILGFISGCALGGQTEQWVRFDTQVKQCERDLLNSRFDPIRERVSLTSPPTFDMLSSTAYPTTEEQNAIRDWAQHVLDCNNRVSRTLAGLSPLHEELLSSTDDTLTALLAKLHNHVINYGEFNRSHREMVREYQQQWARINQTLSQQQQQIAAQQLRDFLALQEKRRARAAEAAASAAKSVGVIRCQQLSGYLYCTY